MNFFYNDVEDEDGTLICRVSGDGESQKMSVGRGNVLTVYNIEAPLTNRRTALEPYFEHSKIVKKLQSAQQTITPIPIKMKIKYSMKVPPNTMKSFVLDKVIPMENISYTTPAVKKTLFYLDNEDATKWSKKENALNVEELSEVILSADPAKPPLGYRLKFTFGNLNLPTNRVTEIRYQGYANRKTSTEDQQADKPFFFVGAGGAVYYTHDQDAIQRTGDGMIMSYIYHYRGNKLSDKDGRLFAHKNSDTQAQKDKPIFEVNHYIQYCEKAC